MRTRVIFMLLIVGSQRKKGDSCTILQYQGVKEFHMLARIVVIVKLWLSVHLNMKPHIITHPMVTNDKTSSILKKPLKHFVKMV